MQVVKCDMDLFFIYFFFFKEGSEMKCFENCLFFVVYLYNMKQKVKNKFIFFLTYFYTLLLKIKLRLKKKRYKNYK